MLLQTNSYIVPRDKRAEHARLLRRFRQTLLRLGCDHFEVYEQVGANWNSGDATGRFVQIMRFRDRRHQLAVQTAERTDPVAQQLVKEFCELVNFPYQQQHGLFAVGFYTSFMKMPSQASTAPAADVPEPASSAETIPGSSPEPGVIESGNGHGNSHVEDTGPDAQHGIDLNRMRISSEAEDGSEYGEPTQDEAITDEPAVEEDRASVPIDLDEELSEDEETANGRHGKSQDRPPAHSNSSEH